MRLALSLDETRPHLPFLQETPGGYEWWYFDAVSHDGRWTVCCIWFLGNPFSPYYRLAAQGRSPSAVVHNALFFALYDGSMLSAYHFTRFAPKEIRAPSDSVPLLAFGPNTLHKTDGVCILSLHDENANRRTLDARLTFTAPPPVGLPDADDGSADDHLWCPAWPAAAVSAQITLRGRMDEAAESIAFTGHGYHDHNRGALPFSRSVRDWYWARTLLEDGSALLVYHVRQRRPLPDVSHVLRFVNGELTLHDTVPVVALSRPTMNAFGRVYFTRLTVRSGSHSAVFNLQGRLDSAPFYVRSRGTVTLTGPDGTLAGDGVGEWFDPHGLGSALAASAMKARILDRA